MIQETFPMIIGEEEMKNERQLLTVEDGPLMQGRESVRYLILHCSATRCDKDYTAEQLLRDHKTRGFRTVGSTSISDATAPSPSTANCWKWGHTAVPGTVAASASATRAVWMRTDIRQTPGPQSRQNSLPCC